ncbi:MAG: sigma-54 dependent transcriptional regulator [Steroidobacteraceae bacterium]|jgi:two-component system, NtrC family, response regulator HydG
MSMPMPAYDSIDLPAPICLLGESAAMQDVSRLIGRVAPTDASVLLTGESGTGKELAAQAIHARSMRKSLPFVVINCGAVPAGLLEAELFGREPDKGGLTAIRARAGAFERARGGTLLLDEITEMPRELQARLLRVLETRRFYRVGASADSNADVRVIAATNRCPLQAVESGQLREDLLYRLAVFPIALPPLRDRGADVFLLAEHFLRNLNALAGTGKRLSAGARTRLQQHSWPGNVRELENCIERAFILGEEVLELAPLAQNLMPAKAAEATDLRGRVAIRVGSRIEDMERTLIEATLDHFQGNKRRSADALGCSLKTLYNKLNGYSQNQQFANS